MQKKLLKFIIRSCFFLKVVVEYKRIIMWCRICTTIGEVNVLPNIKSAKKRVKVTESKTLQNQMFKTSFKTTLKKFEKAVEAGDKAVAETCYKDAVSKIDKAVAKGVLHVNAGARKKSQFTVKLNAMK